MVRSPFSDSELWSAGNISVTNDYLGSLPYTTTPHIDHPYAANLRPAGTPPITSPVPQSRNKAGVPAAVSPKWWGTIGGSTVGPGSGSAPARTTITGTAPTLRTAGG